MRINYVGLITNASELKVGESRWVRVLWFREGIRNCIQSLKLRTQVYIPACGKSLKMVDPKYTQIKIGSFI